MLCTHRNLLWIAGLFTILGTAGEARADRHALLVGCTKYPNLDERFQLTGPANDVELVRSLLRKHFGFDEKKIVVLSEAEGAAQGKDAYPTRANIQREFERLARAAGAGDQVFISMSGHGSQQPESGRGEPKPDGMDEVFLPADAGEWEDNSNSTQNVILDKDLALWLFAIRDKKASVCVILDSCHSATMTRGTDAEKLRELRPEDLKIPAKRIKEAKEQAAQRSAKGGGGAKDGERARGFGPPEEMPFKLADQGGLVAIYAAQATEPTVERLMPPRNPSAKPHGLLTYTLCQVLTESLEKASRPLTYRELLQRVHQQYVAWGRTFPTPVIEGGDSDREVFGDKVWAGRSSIALARGVNGLKINAGTMHGITPGSILSVQPPAGQGEKIVGHVEVKEVRMHDADVVPCAYEKAPKAQAKDLPSGGVCKVVYVDFGDQVLRVAVDDQDEDGQKVPEEVRAKLIEECKKLEGEKTPIQVVKQPRQADWIVRPTGGNKVLLVPVAGWSGSNSAGSEPAFGPRPVNSRLADWLSESLSRIRRAQNLVALAARMPASGDLGVKIKVEIDLVTAIRLDSETLAALKKDGLPDTILTRLSSLDAKTVTSRKVLKKQLTDLLNREEQDSFMRKILARAVVLKTVLWPSPNLVFFHGDELTVRIANPGRVAADVTALFVDGGYGIACLFPEREEFNRLNSGDRGVEIPLTINARTTGQENLLVIAVKAADQKVSLAALAQPSLERFRAVPAGKANSFQELLAHVGYGDGKTRGVTRDRDDAEDAMQLTTWQVRAGKRPTDWKP